MLGHDYIGTEHLLLGVLQVDDPAERAFATAGVTLEDARRVVQGELGHGGKRKSHIPFTPSAKRVLELSLRESIRHKQKFIAPAHIALALLGEPEGRVVKVLVALGTDLDGLSEALSALAGQGDEAAARYVMHPAAERPVAMRSRAEIAALRAERDALADGLRRYGRHDAGCPAEPGRCSCGLAELLASIDESRHPDA